MKDLDTYTDITRNFAIIGVVVWSPGTRDGQVASAQGCKVGMTMTCVGDERTRTRTHTWRGANRE